MTTRYMTFLLAGVDFGLPLDCVHEVVGHAEPTRVPNLPAVIRGVINLRGAIVPVVDLAARLGLPAARPGRRRCLAVVESADAGRFAFSLDEVRDLLELEPVDISPPPAFGAAVAVELVAGVARAPGGLVLLLDAAKALSAAEILAVAGAAA